MNLKEKFPEVTQFKCPKCGTPLRKTMNKNAPYICINLWNCFSLWEDA